MRLWEELGHPLLTMLPWLALHRDQTLFPEEVEESKIQDWLIQMLKPDRQTEQFGSPFLFPISHSSQEGLPESTVRPQVSRSGWNEGIRERVHQTHKKLDDLRRMNF